MWYIYIGFFEITTNLAQKYDYKKKILSVFTERMLYVQQ